jgi:hypothetical protein
MVSTTLILVMLTTLIFGTFMGKVQKMLVPATVEDKEEYLEERRHASYVADRYINEKSIEVGRSTHYEEIIHPNEENDDIEEEGDQKSNIGWVNSRFVRWFGRFDEEKLRPFFIRKYNSAKTILEDEYQELLKLKFKDQQDEDLDLDLVDRVDNMRRTISAA